MEREPVLANLPVVRSRGARALFLSTALLTAAILWWSRGFASTHGATLLAPIFLYLFTLDYPATICALLIIVVAAFVPQKYSFRPLLSWMGDHVWPIAGVFCISLCVSTLAVYLNHPLTMDEYAPYFQSQVFAAGHLTGQFPPGLVDWLVPAVFQNYFFFVSHSSGHIISAYWPSFALLLTPFTFLGIPWACNPVISALTLPVIHRLALRIFADREAAGLAVLLTLASPVIFADGMSYYSMPAHLLANSVFALLLLDPTPSRAFAAGLVGSVALTLHNPVPHMLFAPPWILAIARRGDAAKLTGCLLGGYLPLCVLLGLGWPALISHVTHEGTATIAAEPDGPSVWILSRLTSTFSLPDFSILLARWVGIVKVWVWAVPGMMLLAVAGAWKWRRHQQCRLLVASALVTLIGYVLVPVDQGHGWGYRYFHSAWMVLPLLSAGALARLPARMQPSAQAPNGFLGRLTEDSGVRTYLVACALLTLTLACGLRAVQVRDFMSSQMTSRPAYAGTERQVVILEHSSGLDPTRNDPWLRGNAIYLFSHGQAADAAMMRANFPGLHAVFSDSQGSVWSTAPVETSTNPVGRL